MRNLGCFEKGLAWNAAGPRAVASDAALFDHRHLGAKPSREARRRETSRSSANDHQVVVLFGHSIRSLPSCLDITREISASPNVAYIKPSTAYRCPITAARSDPAMAPMLSRTE